MNGKQYAEHLGIPYGTVKRWLLDGLPAERGGRSNSVRITPSVADAWVRANRSTSVSFARASSIYIVRREDGAIKIGWTSDVSRRLAELRKDCDQGVMLLAAFPGDKTVELSLHNRFAAHRLDGEWFMPCDGIAELLESLRLAAA